MNDAGAGQLRPWLAYAAASALTAGTLLARLFIGPAPGDLPLLIIFAIPIILSAYLGGLGPGLFSTAIAALGTNYFLLLPIHSLHIDRPANRVQWAVLIVTGALVSLVTEALHRSRRKAIAAQEPRLRSQKLEALGTLAGGIAHDFNNVLLAISGNAKLALAALPQEHPSCTSLMEISKAAGRASDLVRQILAFSRPQELKTGLLELCPVVKEALELVRATLPAMIEIRTEFAADAPAVVADASQVHQIIVNLATNAAYAIGRSAGLIEVKLEKVHVNSDHARASQDLGTGSYCLLSMSDDGCGMNRATLQRIFDPFFTTKPTAEGTGLGLSVVHGIMKGHGGAITAYSQPGKGSTFRLYFPAAAGKPAPPQSPPTEIPRGRGARVLYVDDDEALIFLAQRLLKALGDEVTAHTDPVRALAEFRARPEAFDVVVTDVSMPRMSGFDLAEEMLSSRSDVPIIMTSGYLRQADKAAADRIGIRALIPKPDTVDELGHALAKLLSP